MLRLQNISIRKTLILMQVCTSLLVLGLFFTVYVITDIKSYKQRKVDDMMSLAQVIGTNSISTLQFQDNDAAKEILLELHKVAPEIIYAGIIDNKEKLFASYPKTSPDSFHIPAALQGSKYLFSDHYLYVTNAIRNDKEIIGNVVFKVELSELEKIKQSKFEVAFMLFAISIGFAFLVAIVIQHYISRRLLYLVDAMKEVSKSGDYTKPLPEEGRDEISTLIRVFNNLMRRVKENEQRKDEFVGIASHELKTPLTSVKGYLQLLSGTEDKQVQKQFVQKAVDSTNKLENLIKDLLDVSRIQSGQLQLTLSKFDMDHFLDETIASFPIISTTHEIIRESNFNHALVHADKQRIEQVLINLLSNAIKYSPGEKKVIVYSKKTNTELIIKIRDFGIGVPKEEQANIFERFYRTKNMSRYISGFGLGLYICKDIIKRHKGRIWMEAEEKGSAFYFSLPLNNTAAN